MLLFVPGNRPERIAKALVSGADAVVVDLEDSVGAAHKDPARAAVIEALGRRRIAAPLFGVRPNRLTTRHGLDDLVALLDAACAPDFLVLPKVETPFEPQMVAGLTDAQLICSIESVCGLECAGAIAAASPSVAAVGFGGVDFAGEVGARLEWEPMLPARARVVWAAAAAGVAALDAPSLDLRAPERLAADCRRARELGFGGKFAIHPNQIPAIREAFTPTAAEVEHAAALLRAVADADGNAAVHDGAMIDAAVLRQARLTLDRAGR